MQKGPENHVGFPPGVEWAEQGRKLVKLGLGGQDYMDSLPYLDYPKPGKLNIIVDPRISWEKLAELAGFKGFTKEEGFDKDKLSTWPNSGSDPRTGPHVVEIDNGQTSSKTWEKASKSHDKKKERGTTILEGIYLVIYHPEILDNYRIDLPGTHYNAFDIVEIYKDQEKGEIKIGHVFVANTNEDEPKRVFLYSTQDPQKKAA